MPELPEVETIRKILASQIVGKTIVSVNILKHKSFIGNPKDITGSKIISIDRRAKQLIIKLSNGKYLVIHLKMSGQILISNIKNKISKIQTKNQILPHKHTRVIIEFKDGSRLFFNDMRMFGWIKAIKNYELRIMNSKFGPEPLGKEFTVNYLRTVFVKSNRPIKQVLLDQKIIAGIGNIYANDILYLAKIRPTKITKKLSNLEIKQLRKQTIEVLNKAIKYKGSSAKDELYVQPTGEKGSYQEHFLVYQREGQLCKQCGGKIKRIKQAGRSSFYCPRCQK